MSAPRFRAKLAAPPAGPTASEKDETMKGKGKADGAPEDGDEKKNVKKGGKDTSAAPASKPADPAKARMKGASQPKRQAVPAPGWLGVRTVRHPSGDASA